MEENMVENVANDEIIVNEENLNDEANFFDNDLVRVGGGVALGLVAIAGAVAYKKYGSVVKQKLAEHQKKTLLKKQAKLIEKQLKIEAKIQKIDEENSTEEK